MTWSAQRRAAVLTEESHRRTPPSPSGQNRVDRQIVFAQESSSFELGKRSRRDILFEQSNEAILLYFVKCNQVSLLA